MNKIYRRHIEYSEGVRCNKLLRFKKAQCKYVDNRSARNFNTLKKLSDDFQKYNRVHMNKFSRFHGYN